MTGDVALLLNGRIIVTADPQFETPLMVEEAGKNLADALKTELNTLYLDAELPEDWNWRHVINLINMEPLDNGPSTPMHV